MGGHLPTWGLQPSGDKGTDEPVGRTHGADSGVGPSPTTALTLMTRPCLWCPRPREGREPEGLTLLLAVPFPWVQGALRTL